MTKILILALLFLFSVANAKTPIGFKEWKLDNDTTFAKQIGGAVRNYQNPEMTWATIENGFEIEGDSVVYVEKSVLRTRVNKNGVSRIMLTWNDQEYTVTQKMLGIGWIKISTRQSQWIDSTMNWSNFSVDSNICKWTGISPGVDYRVRKSNGCVEHGIFYKPAFLDSAVILYNQRPDSLDIALANVMVYTLSANIDDADSAMGELSWRRLKDFGYYSFNLRNQWLRFPGCDTLPKIPVRQYWERRGTKIFCVEYVMMRLFKQVHEAYPSATIWHNDTKVFSGTTNVEDNTIDSVTYGVERNLGVAIYLKIDADSLSDQPQDIFKSDNVLIRVRNVASEIGAGATITNVVCSLYKYAINSDDGGIEAFRVFKPWVEGIQNNVDCVDSGSSWMDWNCTAKEWTTEGCACAGDDGVDNSWDGGNCNNSARRDRKATAEGSAVVPDDDSWCGFSITAALGQGWYDGTINEEGVVLISNTYFTSGHYFRSTEYATSNQPFWVFTYTTAAAVGKIMRTVIR